MIEKNGISNTNIACRKFSGGGKAGTLSVLQDPSDPIKNGMEHLARQFAGEGILLAGVVRGNERQVAI